MAQTPGESGGQFNFGGHRQARCGNRAILAQEVGNQLFTLSFPRGFATVARLSTGDAPDSLITTLPAPPDYRGRFAPTPSGPLHFGSLVTALGSYLCAHALGGKWFLRLDDLDAPRLSRGAADTICRQLEAHGLHWHGTPRMQSAHVDEYAAALAQLERAGLVYACRCTRAQLRLLEPVPSPDPVYPGRCRDAGYGSKDASLRVRLPPEWIAMTDRWRGQLRIDLQREVGDFILRRRDGQFAYQLASAVDESALGITEVIRGEDLLSSSFRQIHLIGLLGLPAPTYGHLPLALDSSGRKLSKQNQAAPIDPSCAAANLSQALRFLRQVVPADATRMPVGELLQRAIGAWAPQNLTFHQPRTT